MVLTWTASLMLQHLIDQLPTYDEFPLHVEVNRQLLEWKLKFELINDYIEKIDRFFGVVLLGYMAKQLFNIVAYIYWLAVRIQQSREFDLQMTLAVYLSRNLAYVFLLSFVSYRIKQKVRKADRRLRDLKFSDNIVQCQVNSMKNLFHLVNSHLKLYLQVNFITIDINLNSPKITAMGLFEIGPHLIPSVIIR